MVFFFFKSLLSTTLNGVNNVNPSTGRWNRGSYIWQCPRSFCFHSLFGGVWELVFPLPIVTFLNPRVTPQALDGIHVRVCQCCDLLHIDPADNGGVCLNNRTNTLQLMAQPKTNIQRDLWWASCHICVPIYCYCRAMNTKTQLGGRDMVMSLGLLSIFHCSYLLWLVSVNHFLHPVPHVFILTWLSVIYQICATNLKTWSATSTYLW